MRQDRHFVAREMLSEQRAGAVPHWVAAREHDDAPAALRGNGGDRLAERLAPRQTFRRPLRHHRQMANAADDDFRCLYQRARGWGKPGEAVVADADHGEPRFHWPIPMAIALTAAAASALPPRLPLRAINSRSPNAQSAAFASAAPTKPTGKPSTNAGFGAPSAIISSR